MKIIMILFESANLSEQRNETATGISLTDDKTKGRQNNKELNFFKKYVPLA